MDLIHHLGTDAPIHIGASVVARGSWIVAEEGQVSWNKVAVVYQTLQDK